MKNTIIKPDIFGKLYGGNAYEKHVVDVLKDDYGIQWLNVVKDKSYYKIFINLIKIYYLCKTNSDDIVFLNFLTIPFYPFKKSTSKAILLVHHIDWSKSKRYSAFYQKLCFNLLLKKKDRFNKIIVVSQFWKDYLMFEGFSNVYLIYNSINPNIRFLQLLSKSEFIRKYDLQMESYIYLGNAQKGKGWPIAYEYLKDQGNKFIISGNKDSQEELPQGTFYINPSYLDYLAMLKYADCSVLLSTFREGWNRTAHESILMGTPVIGSKSGGMTELLEKSGQIICNEYTELPELIKIAINNRESMSNKGWNYLKDFDEEYFKKSWLEIFNKM